jgi:hypothetical protein
MSRRFVAVNVVLALVLWTAAGCAFVASGPTGPPPESEPSERVVSSLAMADGHLLTLLITQDDVVELNGTAVRNRCWSLRESDAAGTIVQTVGACTRGDDPATHLAIDATALVTSCASPSIAVGPTAEALTAELPAQSGTVLIPAEITGGRLDSLALAFACVNADGSRQPAVVVDLS